MSVSIDYPSATEMTEILPDLMARGKEGRIGLSLFPTVNKQTFHVRWVQQDNYFGLQQMRGMDGSPPRVRLLGSSTYVYEPGVYGEHILITEREIMTRAIPTRPDIPIPISDLTMSADKQLIGRELDRQEANVWTLLLNGIISIPLPGPTGLLTSYQDSYTTQTYNATVPWATSATATPIVDFQKIQQLSVGHSVDFGAGATAYMNQVTANRLLNNANASDYGGRRTQYGATLNALPAFNSYFQAQGLPQIVIVDYGYQPLPISGPETTPSTQFTKFIPDGKAVVVGKRTVPGNVGEIQMTINAANPNNAPGPYRFVKDYAQGINAPKEIPPKVEVHRGWNGGLALFYPSAIVSCQF